MSADIDRMVKEAEASKAVDQKRREAIDLKNESDTMSYNAEKHIKIE
jgi:molecular chaperone DnaK